MVKKIIKYPDSILKRKCREIKEINKDIKKLGREMIEVLEKNEGIGLAASQIGELKRMIVVQTQKSFEIFINPEIVAKSRETETAEEGCLSFPELFLKIKRAKRVEVEALNLSGEKIRIKAEGLLSRIFQHEIDHLDGILFIDRLSFLQKIKNRLLRMSLANPKKFPRE